MDLIASANRHAPRVQWISLAAILVAVFSVIQLLPMEELVVSMRRGIGELGVWGPVAYGVLYVIATVLVLPGAIITLAGGAMFGPFVGTLTVSLASTTGASLAFLIARYFARERVERRLAEFPKFGAIDRAIGERGWRIVGMLRLSPAIPFSISNYLYGLTSISFWPYVLTSWIAMAPGTFMYVYLGYLGAAGVESAVTAGNMDASAVAAQWLLRVVGLAATVGVTVYVTRLARRAIAEQTDIDSDGTDEAPAELAPTDDSLAPASWPWKTTATAAVALSLLLGASYARIHRVDVERYAAQLVSSQQTTPEPTQ